MIVSGINGKETMTDEHVKDLIDDYLDGALDAATAGSVDRHVADCDECRSEVAAARELRSLLVAYGDTTPAHPGDEFYTRALLRATAEGSRRQRRRWVMSGVGGTIAAALVVWLMSGIFFTAPTIDEAPLPAVTMALEEPRTLNLVFSSAVALSDATMTVILPDGVELAGFPGQREIVWMTSLNEGKNILPLTLIATSPAGGELLATLRHQDDDKSFRVRVTII